MLFYDFIYFYAVALILHAGGNPYDYEQYQSTLALVGMSSDRFIPPFPYPPWSLWLIYLYGFFGKSLALTVASVAGVICTVVFKSATQKQIGVLPPWLTKHKLYLLLLVFPPFFKCIFFGQITWVPLLGIGGGLFYLDRKRFLYAGLLMSLTLIKPHLWLPLYAFILGIGLYQKNWHVLLGIFAGGVLQLALSYLIFPYDAAFVVNHLLTSPHGEHEAQIVTASLCDLISSLMNVTTVRYIGIPCGIWYGLRLAYVRRIEDISSDIVNKIIPVALLCTPYTWSHDYLSLFPFLLAQSLKYIANKGERVFLWSWVGGSLFLSWLLSINQEKLFVLLLLTLLSAPEIVASLRHGTYRKVGCP